ncbi:hypothetical protein CSC76_18650 [Pseudoxanthomonas mexicana]|jgi:hypothetical protein|nr:hypothetical protein CSC76_18650 [Pseudoxanthomonas mexicana]
MAGFNRDDFWAELDATDEAFVRRKCATGGYSPAKQRVVKEWLALQDAKRKMQWEAADRRVVGRTAFWTSVTAYAATLTALAAVAALFVK